MILKINEKKHPPNRGYLPHILIVKHLIININ